VVVVKAEIGEFVVMKADTVVFVIVKAESGVSLQADLQRAAEAYSVKPEGGRIVEIQVTAAHYPDLEETDPESWLALEVPGLPAVKPTAVKTAAAPVVEKPVRVQPPLPACSQPRRFLCRHELPFYVSQRCCRIGVVCSRQVSQNALLVRCL
jgi:hypothetical protein